jgi:hypothetical protein
MQFARRILGAPGRRIQRGLGLDVGDLLPTNWDIYLRRFNGFIAKAFPVLF